MTRRSGTITAMLTMWRRHLKKCPHRRKGRAFVKCSCPIWADGELDGKRYRRALDTRDWGRALRKLADLEAGLGAGEPEQKRKPIAEAIASFHDATQDVAASTKRSYTRILRFLEKFTTGRGLKTVDQIDLEALNAYRSFRPISSLTWSKELQVLRHFFRFCVDCEWIEKNPAKLVTSPRNIKPAEREPYQVNEIAKIIAACDTFGKYPCERLRARAAVLLLRYTALRISDVAMLAKDRVRNGEIFLRTEKNGKPVKLPVHPDLQAALDILPIPRGADGPDCPYFFWSGHGSMRSVVRDVTRTVAAVYKASKVPGACSHRFRHTLATEVLELGGTFEEAADILGDSAAIVRKHYAKWSVRRQARISGLLARLWHTGKTPPVSVDSKGGFLVDGVGLEPTTPALRTPCSPN